MLMIKFLIVFFVVSTFERGFCEDKTKVSDYYNMEWVSSMGASGVFKDAQIVEKLVYCATGRGLEVIDISDYAKPKSISRCATPGEAEGICVFGHYAYIADGSQGLRIIDIFDPNKPQEVGYWKTNIKDKKINNYIMDVVVDGKYAYVVDCGYGMWVIDISYPSHPREVIGVKTPGASYGIAIKNQKYAYIADYSGGLRIIDISEPEHAYELGGCKVPGMALKVAIYSDKEIIHSVQNDNKEKLYALVAMKNEGLHIVNVSNPENPKVVSSYRKGRIVDVTISGTNAWLADLDCRIRVLDISNILSPCEVRVLDRSGPYEYTEAITIDGFLVCVCNLREGLSFFDVSQADNPQEVGGYDAAGQSYALALDGDYLYSAQYEDGMQIIDIKNPQSPLKIGCYDTDGAVWDISLTSLHSQSVQQGEKSEQVHKASTDKMGFYACVADDVGGFWVIDVTEPTSPKLSSKYKTPQYARGISSCGSYAYVANYSGGLSIMDISDPTSPKEMGRYESVGYVWDVECIDGYCYLAGAEAGLLVIDVRQPTNPKEVGRYNTHGYVWSLALVGGYCYLADGDGGLRVIEVSDPRSPFEVGHLSTDGCATGITIDESDHLSIRAYIADGNAGIVIVDMSEPTNPIAVGKYDTPGYARDIQVSGDYIFVADSEGGVITLRVSKSE